ncbi:MAG: histidine--tRNA ligase [Eubacteriales bacterium]|nr:histidine--tRNA ligase [Eubacteriales bacterium]
MLTKCPKGTKDVTPQQSYKWHYVENMIRDITARYGYREVRTPVFEHTELFARGIGDTTDVVQKEMYTFLDKGGRSVTLKPEGTAGAARAYIENNLSNEPRPAKMYYFTPVFRYENPQSGRLREHHQFGVEVFGAGEPSIDAEIVALASEVFDKLGIRGVRLNINSIGCPTCRARYNEALRAYLEPKKEALCELCRGRAEKNPMRVIDCKNQRCQEQIRDIPLMLDYLCDDCKAHFAAFRSHLDALGIAYTVNGRIVRGLDYYTKTVVEFIADVGDGELTVCGGGRYDGLIAQLGGEATCGIGFGMGIERLLMVMEKCGVVIPEPRLTDVFIASLGERAQREGLRLCAALRAAGVKADVDHCGRSFKGKFKYADKIGAPIVCVMGDDELDAGAVKLRLMKQSKEITVALDDAIDSIKGELEHE